MISTLIDEFLLTDQVGTLRAVVDYTGMIVKRIDYDSFGNIIADTNPGFSVPFGFAGGLYDRDTNLVRFGYRDYSPELGRFVAKDPLDFGGGDTNLYAYVMNDPINFTDPLGLKLVNNYPGPVLVKPERTNPIWMPGNSTYPGAIDGTKPPAGGGNWYKVWDGTDLTINPDGTVSGGGPDFPDFGRITDPLQGWKDEPGFSGRHDDWKEPPFLYKCH